ncbi:MAG: carboxypeptidase-like regulatory domain-containing protein, partial [Opitutaceae bacterium]
MQRTTLPRLAALILLLALGPIRARAADAVLTGQVSNAATRAFLEGATVAIAGTAQSTVTDREGRFTLPVPAGSDITVVANFTGLDPQRATVRAADGQRVTRDFALTAEVYKLDKFTVAGEREGTALAEALQRQAPNVKAIVSSDTFGNVADGNVGDLLQRIAGITANYNGHDVRQVSIRGVGPDLNAVTMD